MAVALGCSCDGDFAGWRLGEQSHRGEEQREEQEQEEGTEEAGP